MVHERIFGKTGGFIKARRMRERVGIIRTVDAEHPFVSRGGLKLDHALKVFGIDVTGEICADLGCSTGGFTDCLLHRGAARVFSVDTGYGVIDWRLRNDERVVVMERTNAMHVQLPERVGLVVIDAGWTKQKHILPHAKSLLQGDGMGVGRIVSLIKPHYEADVAVLRKGILPDEGIEPVLEAVRADIAGAGLEMVQMTDSPIKGAKGNSEFLALLVRGGPMKEV